MFGFEDVRPLLFLMISGIVTHEASPELRAQQCFPEWEAPIKVLVA